MNKKKTKEPASATSKKVTVSRQELMQNATMFENFMVPLFFEHDSEEAREALEGLLRVLLNDPHLVVEEFHAEHVMSNTGHHGIRIDVWAKDGRGRQIALELQKETDEEVFPRAVFEGATMEVHSLAAGRPYSEMVKAIVIFVMLKDLPGKGMPVYVCETLMNGTRGTITEVAPTYVFVNGAYRNDKTEIGRQIADILQPDPDKMYTPTLRRRMEILKKTKEGRHKMSAALDKYFEEYFEERMEEYLEEAYAEWKKDLLMQFARQGLLTVSQAAEQAGMSVHAFEHDMRLTNETEDEPRA